MQNKINSIYEIDFPVEIVREYKLIPTGSSITLTKIKFKGRNTLFIAYIGTIAVPFQVYMIPQFIIIRKIGLNDSLLSLILIQAFTAYGVFLLRQFYMSIPEELSESARMQELTD